MISVLVVGSDPDEASALARVLLAVSPPSFRVQLAPSHAAAVVVLGGGDVDAVLLDLDRPATAGLEAVRRMRASTGAAIAVRVAPESEDVAVEALRQGAEAYLLRGEGGDAVGRAVRHAVVRRESEVALTERASKLVAEAKRLEREHDRLRASESAARLEAERSSRMKDEFLSTLSHELRTPLHAILGWTQLLGRTGGKDLARGVEVIERNARAQAKIVDDLLDMNRIICGKIHIEARRMYPASAVEAALEAVSAAAEAKGLRLERTLDPMAGPIRGDPARIQQIVWNLLSNAIKFTPPKGTVRVVLDRIDTRARVTVSDTGVGIEADFLPLVFDRFLQADGSTTRRFGGLGLGLAIVKQLAELHGGVIHAASGGAGQGAVFCLEVPLHDGEIDASDLEGEMAPVKDRSWLPVAGPSVGALDGLVGVDVLVVDDEPDARDLVRRMLEEQQARVRTAASAREALERLAERAPDVLVSDIGMPEIDGYELIRRIRALGADEGGTTPAVALSAFARSEDKTWAVLSGYQSHISKPVRAAELIAVVAGLAKRGDAAAVRAQG